MAPSFLILNLKKKGVLWNFLFKYVLLLNYKNSGMQFLEGSEEKLEAARKNSWPFALTFVAQMVLNLIDMPVKYFGYAVDFVLNFISQNGGLIHIINNILRGKLVIPKSKAENFLSSIGETDPRMDLLKSVSLDEKAVENLGSRELMDLCVMSSKLAYEKREMVEDVVKNRWKMNYVDFYECWNAHLQAWATQVFIFTDKPKDAGVIVVSFRGTEIFSVKDWCTDFDFSFYEVKNVGKIHVGFLEAMGLGHRSDVSTFATHLQRKNVFPLVAGSTSQSHTLDMDNDSAYYKVANQLSILLKEHSNAKFVVTGHSLGGALAILFPTVLLIQEEAELLKRLRKVYTFGQPRIGDQQLGSFIGPHLSYPDDRYYRVVYCNDIVPRVPFDNKCFQYKHFGKCLYYNSFYCCEVLDEVPNPNYFGLKYFIPMRLNAIWELLRSLTSWIIVGPEYMESLGSILYRVIGLAFPGVAAHSLVNYVNSVRLGEVPYWRVSSTKEN